MRRDIELICGVLALWLLLAGVAMAEDVWWNPQWKLRKKITVNTGAAGADIKAPLADMPVLLRLHTGNFNFAATKPDGSDLRVVAPDNKTLLKHRLERYDSVEEVALVWVKVPSLAPQASQDIFLYYGNAEAPDQQDPKAAGDGFTTVLLNFTETEGPPQDSGSGGLAVDSHAGTQGLPGVMGAGFGFSGPGDRIAWNSSPAFNPAKGLTASLWVRLNQPLDDAVLLAMDSAGMALELGFRQDRPFARVALKTEGAATAKDGKQRSAGPVAEAVGTNALEQGKWHHLALSLASKDRLVVYVDGAEAASAKIDIGLPEAPAALRLGSDTADQRQFIGDIDAFQVSATTRPADWVKATFAGQGLDTAMVTYDVEIQGQSPNLQMVYMKIIIGALTFDSIAVIAAIVIFGTLVWMVFFGKLLTFGKLAKANRRFLEAFRQLSDPLGLEPASAAFAQSRLFEIYQEVHRSLCGTQAGVPEKSLGLGTGVIKQFKTKLDRAYVEESRRLNAYMELFPMAIAGSPFLGLLGTVWGVMNTFAAMADAGDANILAIAPGVASALAATVSGLLVAIPALFIHNFLVGRIKGLTVELTLFLDELAVKVENVHGAS